jgi:hypothetical protein
MKLSGPEALNPMYGGTSNTCGGTLITPFHGFQNADIALCAGRMAQVDMRARNEVLPLTLKHLQATHADLRELKHLQLLCDSYRTAQARVFAAADPDDLPPVHPRLARSEGLVILF